MGRAPCCDKANVKKGPWSPEEDAKLKDYIEKHGTGGNWIALPQKAGLKRCGKSCRLRWLNYLRPNIKHGEFSDDEDRMICTLFASIGSRWSIIASQLPGRTDNDIKNYWNTKLKKKLMANNIIINPSVQRKSPQSALFSILQNSSASSSSSPSSPLSFRESPNPNYYNPTTSFKVIGSESISYSSNILQHNPSTSANSRFHPQESFMGPMQQNCQVKDSVFVFGGEASCSSSDGTFVDQIAVDNYLYSTGVEETQKILPSNVGSVSGLWGEINELDYYGLEEIKQLISTNGGNDFLFDENKTEEKVMFY